MSKNPSADFRCYGDFHKNFATCKRCPCADYCREATSLNFPSGKRLIPLEKVEYSLASGRVETGDDQDEPQFTKADMLEMVAFMTCLDIQTLDLIALKLQLPVSSFAEIAREHKVSRQAIHKFIRQKCSEVPELQPVLLNPKNRSRNSGTDNFMEAVWKIKQQTSASDKKSNTSNNDSKSSGILTSLTRSLDLSRLSIFRGEPTFTDK